VSRFIPATFAVVACLLASSAEAGPGPGGGKGGGRGANGRCGATLSVVLPDGSEQTFQPAGDLFEGLPNRTIDQGEDPRLAVKLTDLLGKMGAATVKTLDCAEKSLDFPSGLPVEGELYVVQTGRGSLKFVREVRPGVFTNVAEKIKFMRFRAAGARGDANKPKSAVHHRPQT
jgi:hypothetical protein